MTTPDLLGRPRYRVRYWTAEPGSCEHCGDERILDLLECWPEERAWMFETCCEGFEEAIHADLEYALELPPMQRRKFLAPLRDLFEEYGIDVRQVFDDGMGGTRLDYGIEARPVRQREAKEFIRQHHRHNPPPPGWKYGVGLFNGQDLVGVLWVGRPVNRVLQARGYLEVNRLCVRDDIPSELVWNACSQAYGIAARRAKKAGHPIITYTLREEDGATLKAAGWVPEAETAGGSWNSDSRPRQDRHPTSPKIRWAPAWCAKLDSRA